MLTTKIMILMRDSFWFVPALYCISAVLLVFTLNPVDAWVISSFQDQIPKVFLTSKEVARQLYASLVTAILTMTTISFSVIMVVLTTYSTQFSPRTLQDFMRSKMAHHVLGVFSFGFIFALVHLLQAGKNDKLIGPILMVIIAIICLSLFIYFIHHSARWVQVNNLIGKLHNDSSRTINQSYTDKEYGEYTFWGEDDLNQVKQQSQETLFAAKSGYVQHIDWSSIVKGGSQHNTVMEVMVQTGDYLAKGMPVIRVFSEELIENSSQPLQCIAIGEERTDIQDIEFTVQKLVEIALKAISPSTNDPHTAINSINRIGTILGEIGQKYKEVYYLADEHDILRVIKEPKRFEDFLYKSFYQIKHYANGDVSIYYSLLEVLYNIAIVSDKAIKRKVWEFHFYIADAIEWDSLQEMDREHLKSVYNKLQECCAN